jgi:FkbM family methyltransferase
MKRSSGRVCPTGISSLTLGQTSEPTRCSRPRLWDRRERSAIEAHPTTFRYLQSNIELNRFSNMIAYQYAIGTQTGITRFSSGLRDDSMNRVTEDGAIEVPLVSLDELLTPHAGEIDLLKVDVEGYERFVFAGATKTLARTKAIYFEVYERNFERFGYCTADVLQALATYGFASYAVEERHPGQPLREDFVPERRMNLLALRRDELTETS